MLTLNEDHALNDCTLVAALLNWSTGRKPKKKSKLTPPRPVLVSEVHFVNGRRFLQERYCIAGGGVYVGNA